MTSSLKRKSLSKPKKGNAIPMFDLGFVRGRNKNCAHSLLLEAFEKSGLSKADLAHMLGKKPEQITRWLSGPGNLTLDSLSDLVFSMTGEFLAIQLVDDLARSKSNNCQVEWWSALHEAERWHAATSDKSHHFETLQSFSKPKVEMDTIVHSARRGGKYEKIRA